MLEETWSAYYDAVVSDWLKRSEYWAAKAAKFEPKPTEVEPRIKYPSKRNRSLVLAGHGAGIQIKNNALVVKNGFSHWPQEQQIWTYYPADPKLPDRIVMIDGSGTMSFAAMDWLKTQGVAFIRIDWRGQSQLMLGGSGSVTDPEKVHWQYETAKHMKRRVAFAGQQIRAKLEGTLDVLNNYLPDTPPCVRAIEEAQICIEQIDARTFRTARELFIAEARAARSYFRAWVGIELNWIDTKAHPVPPRWQVYKRRSAYSPTPKRSNRNATHPLNAMLNYAYALLESDLRIQSLTDGFDPGIGIYHRGREGSEYAFIYDLMEAERPKVDARVLDFVFSSRFSAKDFILTDDGVCRLSPQLARTLIGGLNRP
ncbi:MAG: CRISPR-associated endonuclease Cas1 [Pseudomonadota bacterium]